MAPALIALILTLILSRSLPELQRLRQFNWFEAWLRGDFNPFASTRWWQGQAGASVAVLVPVALMALVQLLLYGRGYHLPTFLLSTLVLIYCIGPRDLDRDVQAILDAKDRDERLVALQDLPPDPPSPPLTLDGRSLVDATFNAALQRWFGVFFWFLLLGASGALMYRLVQLAAQSERFRITLPRGQVATLREGHTLLDWPAAQLMTLSMALAADFDAVLQAWKDFHHQQGQGFLLRDTGFLLVAARASVDAEDDDEDNEAANTSLLPLHQSISLIWRILVVWLAVLALFVLAGWIG